MAHAHPQVAADNVAGAGEGHAVAIDRYALARSRLPGDVEVALEHDAAADPYHAGNVEHDGNGAMRWSIANAKTTSNSFGEIKIDKEFKTERIDIVDAIIDAWTMAMKGEVKPDVNEFVEMWLQQQQKYTKKNNERG